MTILTIAFLVSCGNNIHNTDAEQTDGPDEDTDIEDADIINEPVQDLKVEMNELNVLSCRVTFSTPEKKKIIVKYFSKTHKGYEISEDSEKTDHYFFLWGMKAQTTYNIEIYWADNPDKPIETTIFQTGILPETVPYTFLAVNEKEKVLDGFVLYTYSATVEEKAVPIAMMLDTDGEVIWYFEYYQAGYSIFNDLQYIDKTKTVQISIIKGFNMEDIPAEEAIEIDLEGNIVWKAPAIANVYGDEKSWNHIYERLDDDSIVILRYEPDLPYQTERIVNMDKDYNELWTWSYLDHFEPFSCGENVDWCEWTHSNSVNMFKKQKVTYLNSRNLSTYYKIDMDSGEIIWKFGKDGDFQMVTDHQNPWFELAHDPEPSSADAETVIFYDNGTPERNYSRVIEYSLDTENMTSEITFEYDGSKDGRKWFSEYWGDADGMPNGNIFVTAGQYDMAQQSKMFEVTREGEVVWELFMDKQEEWMLTLYNSQKIAVERLIQKL